MEFIDPSDIWKFRTAILSKVSIIDIAREYGIELESKETGTFTHRAYCPLHTGKGKYGHERTPSMFFSKHSNSFCCFGCIEENSLIWTFNGLNIIKNVKEGDYVLGHDAQFHKILHKSCSFDKEVMNIFIGSCKGFPIQLTKDHECLFIKKEEDECIFSGVTSSIKIGDFFIFPVIGDNDRRYKKIDKELCWLYGLLLAKGIINENFIRFLSDISEIDFILKVLEDVGIKRSLNLLDKNTCEIVINKSDLKFWDINIPIEFIFMPSNLQQCFINGYLSGNRKIVSKKLAFNLYCIAIQSGFFPYLYFHPSYIDKKGIKHEEFWIFSISEKESLYGFFKDINGIRYYCSIIENIISDEKIHKVFDITVESSNSFTTSLCSLHNCGKGGSVINFVSYMDGTPIVVALTRLAKKIGLIDKDGKWDELQTNLIKYSDNYFDHNKVIDPYIFKISNILRNYLNKFRNDINFEKEFLWIEKIAAKVDSFLIDIDYENWEYAKRLSEKVEKIIKKRLEGK